MSTASKQFWQAHPRYKHCVNVRLRYAKNVALLGVMEFVKATLVERSRKFDPVGNVSFVVVAVDAHIFTVQRQQDSIEKVPRQRGAKMPSFYSHNDLNTASSSGYSFCFSGPAACCCRHTVVLYSAALKRRRRLVAGSDGH